MLNAGLLSRRSGFTLIELLVCIALLTIFLFATTSSYRHLVASYAGETDIKELKRLFHSARSEAIRRGEIITICPLNDTGVCGSDWNQAITMFSDPGNLKKLPPDGKPLQQFRVSEIGELTAAPRTRRYFQFAALGDAPGTMGNLTWCARHDDPAKRQQVIVTLAGRVRLAQDMDGDGVREKSDGSAIRC